jgi:hypothetical protein
MNASDAGGLFWVGGMQTALAVGLLVRMQAWMKCWQPYTNGRLARERLSDELGWVVRHRVWRVGWEIFAAIFRPRSCK